MPVTEQKKYVPLSSIEPERAINELFHILHDMLPEVALYKTHHIAKAIIEDTLETEKKAMAAGYERCLEDYAHLIPQ